MRKTPVRVTFTTVFGDEEMPFGKTFTDAEAALSYLGGYLGVSQVKQLSNFSVEYLWEETTR